jgi:hypothetical protein
LERAAQADHLAELIRGLLAQILHLAPLLLLVAAMAFLLAHQLLAEMVVLAVAAAGAVPAVLATRRLLLHRKAIMVVAAPGRVVLARLEAVVVHRLLVKADQAVHLLTALVERELRQAFLARL